ncbi:MAG: hypothetical protein Q7S57_03680 [bacterium]|nr:hypothetical protein [bacterium]
MASFTLLALVVSVLGVLPLLAAKRLQAAGVMASVAFVAILPMLALAVPSLVWPWWGMPGILVVLLWVICPVIDILISNSDQPDEPIKIRTAPLYMTAVLVSVMVLSGFRGCTAFTAGEYANLIGDVDEKVWNQDIQPKDPRHIRMASLENAIALAEQQLGKGGAIGSQFQLLKSGATAQFVNGKFVTVVPLDYASFSAWSSSKGVPGYVVVDNEDPRAEASLVMLPDEKKFVYTPSAYWGYNLERHLWWNGFATKGLDDFTLEIDDSGKPWWTVTVFEPTIYCWGEKMTGVVAVDPVSGVTEFYPVGKIPDWVDSAMPRKFAKSYVDFRGKYSLGWINADIWGHKDLTKADGYPLLVFGSDGVPYFVVSVTSVNDKDASQVGLYYFNTRTGKATYYKASGSTESAVVNAVNKNEQVQFKHLHGSVPQIYNIYGTMCSVVPLLNESHLFQGVAIVDVANIQVMGIGKDQFEALRAFQKALPVSGRQVAPELSRKVETLEGKVSRVAVINQNGDATFYMVLESVPHLFTCGISLCPEKLPVTEVGDTVRIEYYGSGERIEPLHAFDNTSLKIEGTDSEKEVREAGADVLDKAAVVQEKATTRTKVGELSDEEVQTILSKRNAGK